jgi:hypothetical protein
MLDIRMTRRIIYVILASLGAILILINTLNYGIGLTDDSVNYLFSGYHLYKLKGFYGYDGSVFINWPPLYSIVIFLVSVFGSDMNLVMIIFNSLLYFITVILIGRLSEQIFTTPSIKIIYTATLAFSFQMLYLYIRVWSETVFTTLLVLSLLLIIQSNTTKRNVFLLTTISLCLLTRYLGISIIITYYLYKIFLETGEEKRNKNYHIKTLLLSILTFIPAFIWLIRNKIVAGNITGLEFSNFESISKSVFQLLSSISTLFIPESLNVNFRIVLFLILLSVLIIIYVKYSVHSRHNKLLFLLSITYTCVLLILSGIFNFDGLSLRFVLPVYFVLLLILIYPFDYLINKTSNAATKAILYSLLIMIVAFPIEKGIKHTYINFTNGIEGFYAKKWKDSETIKLIKKDFSGSEIYSNSVAGIFANTGLQTKRLSNYDKNGTSKAVLILFNNYLPAIDSIPDLNKFVSEKDSVLYFEDSYIIMKKAKK